MKLPRHRLKVSIALHCALPFLVGHASQCVLLPKVLEIRAHSAGLWELDIFLKCTSSLQCLLIEFCEMCFR